MIINNLVCAFSNLMLDESGHSSARPEPDSTILLAIHAHSGVSIGRIAAMVRLSHSGAVRVVDRLQSAGDVLRAQGSDRRNVSLRLTEHGRVRAERILEDQKSTVEARLKQLSPSDTQRLEIILRQLLDGVAENPLQAWRLCRNCDHGICEKSRCVVGKHLE
jgi:DNA-binding MarR family transcriptional regulator